MAPEVVTRSPGYNKPADWWSFGIFTFDLLTGRSPFHSNRGKQETKERILRGKFHTPAFLTPQAQDLIRRLLRRPVERRLGSKDGATEVKSHDFFGATCWEKVLKKGYKPPFVPSFNGDDDVSNFDARFTSKSPRESDANNSNTVNGKYMKNIRGITFITKRQSFRKKTKEQKIRELSCHFITRNYVLDIKTFINSLLNVSILWMDPVLQCQWTEIGQSIQYFAGYSRSFHNLDIKKVHSSVKKCQIL